MVSSALDRPIPTDVAVFGEVGLLGEVRAVSRAAERVREAAALGFGRVALPARDAGSKLELPTVPIKSVADLIEMLMNEE